MTASKLKARNRTAELNHVAAGHMHRACFHPVGVIGALGAAAGAGTALGLTPQQLAMAFGIAASTASGIIEYLTDGAWTKRLHPGWAAQAGLRAAQLGAAGFRGPGTVFEGTHGLFSAFAPSIDPDFGPLTSDLGTRWETARVAFKPYACGTMTQPYVDCAVRLRRQGIRPEDIKSIVCEVGEGTVHRLWEPLADKQRPVSSYGAKFSLPYSIAVMLVRGRAGLEEFSDEIETWVIDEFKKIGCDTARSVLNLTTEELERRTDLEKETIDEVRSVLKAEFEKE